MRKLLLTLSVLLLILSGCSSRFAYNNLDWLIYWYVDDYVELDRPQRVVFDGYVDQWLVWHRQQELDQYLQHLNDLRQQVAGGPLSQQQWLQHFERGRGHWERLRDRVSPELVEIAVLLNDDQVESLFDEVADQREETEEEYNDIKDEDRLDESRKNLQEQMERWIGRLSQLQKDIVSDYAPRIRPTFQDRLAYQRQLDAKARQLFDQRETLPDFQQQLLDILQNSSQYQSQQLKENSDHNRVLFAHMSAVISQTLSDKQRRHIDKKLGDLADDIEALL